MHVRMLLLLPLLFAASSADVTYDRLLRADREPHNWLLYSGNYSGHRYSPLSQVNRGNVGNLQLKWSYHPLYAKNTNAQNNLGVMYEMGRGVPRDPVQALYYYKQALAAGENDARADVARLEGR